MPKETHDIKIHIQLDWANCPDNPELVGYRSIAVIERNKEQQAFGLPPEIGLAIVQILKANSVEVRESDPDETPPPDNIIRLKQ